MTAIDIDGNFELLEGLHLIHFSLQAKSSIESKLRFLVLQNELGYRRSRTPNARSAAQSEVNQLKIEQIHVQQVSNVDFSDCYAWQIAPLQSHLNSIENAAIVIQYDFNRLETY